MQPVKGSAWRFSIGIAIGTLAIVFYFQACGKFEFQPPEIADSSSLGSNGPDNNNPNNVDLKSQALNVFTKNCQSCHGPQSGALSAFTYANDLNKIAASQYVVAGNPSASKVYQRSTDGTMPPGNPLSSDKARIIADWITSLAHQNPTPTPTPTATPPGGSTPTPTPTPTPVSTPPATNSNAANVLDGARVNVPCPKDPGTAFECYVDTTKIQKRMTTVKTIGGDPSVVYDVKLRIRGIVEGRKYYDSNGVLFQPGAMPTFIAGGSPVPNINYNRYFILVTDPKKDYYLNAANSSSHTVWPLDYTIVIKMRGGTKVEYGFEDSNTGLITNIASTARLPDGSAPGKPLVIPGVEPLLPNGQWFLMNVISATPSAP